MLCAVARLRTCNKTTTLAPTMRTHTFRPPKTAGKQPTLGKHKPVMSVARCRNHGFHHPPEPEQIAKHTFASDPINYRRYRLPSRSKPLRRRTAQCSRVDGTSDFSTNRLADNMSNPKTCSSSFYVLVNGDEIISVPHYSLEPLSSQTIHFLRLTLT